MKKKIGQYIIESRIGDGGMAIVYLGKHAVLETRVAIKVLLENLTRDPSLRERFMNEARIMAKLQHDNIVKVHDFLEHGSRLILVMEYVEGRNLGELIGSKTGPIPYEKALPLFKQILRGVGYAHEKGVVHRDLKPSNVLVTNDDQVKIADFGIAKIAGQASMTRTGTKLGTLCYMSPEQVLGRKTDHRADIYSLGATLYEMLAGVMPRSQGDTSEFEIMKDIIENDLPDPREFYPHIPDWLVSILSDALQRDPDNRISSCDDFLQRLETGEREGAREEIGRAGWGVEASPVLEKKGTVDEETLRTPVQEISNDNEVSKKRKAPWIFVLIFIIMIAILVVVLKSKEDTSSDIAGSSQPPDDPLLFESTYGGYRTDTGWDVEVTSDGGYIMAGYSESNSSGNNFWLVKLDSEGREEWNRTFSNSTSDQAFSVIQTDDGGYVMAGLSSVDEDGDIWVVKANSNGHKEWDKHFSAPGANWAFSLCECSNGDIAVTGATSSGGEEDSSIFFLRLDSNGGFEDSEIYSLYGGQYGYCIIQCSDGGYAILGRTIADDSDNGDMVLLRLNSNGTIRWHKSYGGQADEWGRSVQQLTGGGFIIAGYTSSYGSGGDIWLLEITSGGNIRWSRNIGGSEKDWAYAVRCLHDGGYVIAAKTQSYGSGGYDAWLVRTDSSGNVEWHRTFGGRGDDRAYDLELTSRGYVLGGSSSSSGSGSDDFYLISTDEHGNIE